MRFRPELDGARAIAVLAVVAVHLGIPDSGGGWMGVDVFFVLSGYLITTLLLREHDRFGRISLRQFYARRVLRLYPALLTMLIAGIAFFPLLADAPTIESYAKAAAVSGFYLSDFVGGVAKFDHLGALGHTWSLAVEEQFYLVWPLSLVLLLRFRRNVLLWASTAAGISFLILIASSHHIDWDGISDSAYFQPWSRFSTLLVGCIVALLLHRGVRIQALESNWIGIGLAAAAIALVVIAQPIDRASGFAWQAPAIAIVSAALVWHLTVAARSAIRVALSLKPLVWLGRRSYGIYLYHLPILTILSPDVLHHFWPNLVVYYLAAYLVSITVAALSYRYIELPFLRLKKRFAGGTAQSPGQSAITTAVAD